MNPEGRSLVTSAQDDEIWEPLRAPSTAVVPVRRAGSKPGCGQTERGVFGFTT
jgi:hypothetical protein